VKKQRLGYIRAREGFHSHHSHFGNGTLPRP